ncbi:MAG: leucine-rich repeat protein [Paludibacteraceae bacterium]|nr:leucine-rich repeat protein [Paludibacteraceae bacterium]
MKKIVLISCLLAASSLCLFAETIDANGATLNYTADAEYKATITGATALPEDGILIIPDTFRVGETKYTVTAIGVGAFNGTTALKAVAIPTFVTNIGENAFAGCSHLEWVVVRNTDPKTNVTIGASAFPDFTSGSALLYLHDQYWGAVKLNNSGAVIGPNFGDWLDYFADANIHPYAAVNIDPKTQDAFYGSIYFATYAFTAVWPEGVQAYTATAEGNSLNMNAIPRVSETLTIPADNGVLLRRERANEEDNISFILLTPTQKSESEHMAGNVFRGYENNNVTVLAPSYVLYGDKNHGVGFYRFGGATYQAFRAFYHPASNASAPARISLNFNHSGQTTGEEKVSAELGGSGKGIRNGQLIILRDGREYNAQGQLQQEGRGL